MDYSTECTVCVIVIEGGVENRIVYERPQVQLPNRPLTSAERARALQFANDDELTAEAMWIFDDMKRKGRVGETAELGGIFIARTAAAALEMNL